jgi:cellulose synthase/poly-beta-1,6-N-acetylglucosamine synthase-like glycosyltransferase
VWAGRHWAGAEGHEEIFASPLTPAVSILVPAHDEEAGILDTLSAALGQRYPMVGVVLVDDGSTDRTFELVAARYDLVEVTPQPTADLPVDGETLSVHRAGSGDPLTVIRKTSVGRRSDALNAALNLARYPLVCMVDADSLLEADALLRVARPFVEDPASVVAAGGVIRAANRAVTDRGTVLEPRLSKRWLVRIQTVEYLRSFLLGRTGWADAQALLIISGAFGLFRRDVVLEVGGLDPRSLAEDAELVVTIQEHLRGRDLLALLAAGALEHLGYRQLHAWFRLRGLAAALTRRTPVWTPMPRTGFSGSGNATTGNAPSGPALVPLVG